MTEFAQYTKALFTQEFMLLRQFIGNSAPERQLGFEIDTHKVRRLKSRFRRTAGVETIVIYAITLSGFKNLYPACGIGRGKSRFREHQPVMLAAQECFTAVYLQLKLICFELSEAYRKAAYLAAVAERYL